MVLVMAGTLWYNLTFLTDPRMTVYYFSQNFQTKMLAISQVFRPLHNGTGPHAYSKRCLKWSLDYAAKERNI